MSTFANSKKIALLYHHIEQSVVHIASHLYITLTHHI